MMTSIIFTHVHKTGGIAITKAISGLFCHSRILNHVGMEVPANTNDFDFIATHASFPEVNKIGGPKILITALRSPVSRLISLYRFWKSIRIEHAISIGDGRVLLTKALSFEDFLLHTPEELIEYVDNEMTRHFSSIEGTATEKSFESACQNLSSCDWIIIQENLEEDLAVFFDKIGCANRLQLDRINVTNENKNIQPDVFGEAEQIDFNSISQEAINALMQHTYYDRRLYDYAINLRENKKRLSKIEELGLKVNRPKLFVGETVVPSATASFANILSGGWSEPNEFLWSVGKRSELKFAIAPTSASAVSIVVGASVLFNGNRDYISFKVICNGKSPRNVVFVNNDTFVGRPGGLLNEVDLICTGNSIAEIEFGSSVILTEGLENVVTFEMEGGASPALLGFNHDERQLIVRLRFIKVKNSQILK